MHHSRRMVLTQDAQAEGKETSHKYHWLPYFNVLFLVERALETTCATSLDPTSGKHGFTVQGWLKQYR